jgi:hypothetical protein
MQTRGSMILTVWALALAFPALAQEPPPVNDGSQPTKSIALLRVRESRYYQVRDFYRVASIAGLFGSVAIAETDKKRGEQLVQMINERHVRLSELLVSALRLNIANSHIDIDYLADQFPKIAADKKTDDYSDIHTDKTTILSVWFGPVGFVSSAKLSTEFQPWLIVHARLLDATTKRILYEKVFDVGYKLSMANSMKMEAVPTDPKYRFGDFNDLMGHSDLAIEALSSAVTVVAERIAADVK